MTMPDRLTRLDMVQGDDVTLVVRLPPAQMIVDSEHVLAELGSVSVGSPYPLPGFYREAWGVRAHTPFAWPGNGGIGPAAL